MNLLTIDTAIDKTYITLSKDDFFISVNTIESTEDNYHSAFLITEIAEGLKANNLGAKDITHIATDIGPGSFTGIRASLTVARVMAQQLNIPLVGISSLEILSKINEDKSRKTLVLMDARKGMCYLGIYPKIEDEKLIKLEELELINFEEYFIVSDRFMQGYLTKKGVESVCYTDKSYEFGIFLAELARERAKKSNSKDFNWARVKPLYLQKPSITLPKKAQV